MTLYRFCSAPTEFTSRDNPNGDATSDQTIDDSDTMNGTRTHTYGITVSGADISITGNGDYTAKEALTINSDSTVDVNVAQGKDVQSGSYSSDASEDQTANYSESENKRGRTSLTRGAGMVILRTCLAQRGSLRAALFTMY